MRSSGTIQADCVVIVQANNYIFKYQFISGATTHLYIVDFWHAGNPFLISLLVAAGA